MELEKSRRLELMKQSAWKAKQTLLQKRCRICGGLTNKSKRYCNRHWKYLYGVEAGGLMSSAAIGERLEECDAWIQFRSRLPFVKYEKPWVLRVGPFETVRRSNSNEWVARRMVDGQEREEGRFHSIPQVMKWLIERHIDYSSRNRYATKTLIR